MRQNIEDILKDKQGIRLDIGGGANPHKGFVNIDYRDLPEVDVIQDLEEFPWALPDECVVLAIASHVVEHINPHKGVFINFMNEAWRVLKPDAEFAIVCPYATSPGMYQDPTHCNFINENTWRYFDPLDESRLYTIYKPKPWKIKSNKWQSNGNMEVILVKRREDPSYYE